MNPPAVCKEGAVMVGSEASTSAMRKAQNASANEVLFDGCCRFLHPGGCKVCMLWCFIGLVFCGMAAMSCLYILYKLWLRLFAGSLHVVGNYSNRNHRGISHNLEIIKVQQSSIASNTMEVQQEHSAV